MAGDLLSGVEAVIAEAFLIVVSFHHYSPKIVVEVYPHPTMESCRMEEERLFLNHPYYSFTRPSVGSITTCARDHPVAVTGVPAIRALPDEHPVSK